MNNTTFSSGKFALEKLMCLFIIQSKNESESQSHIVNNVYYYRGNSLLQLKSMVFNQSVGIS